MPPANCVSRQFPSSFPFCYFTHPSANCFSTVREFMPRHRFRLEPNQRLQINPGVRRFFPLLLEEPSVSRWEQVKLTHGVRLSLGSFLSPFLSLSPSLYAPLQVPALSSLLFLFPFYPLLCVLPSSSARFFTIKHRKPLFKSRPV